MKTNIVIISVVLACAGCAGGGGVQLGGLGGGGSPGGFDLSQALHVAKKVNEATREITEEEEIAIGMGIASNILGARNSGLSRDREMQLYVNRVGLWLAAQTERPNLPWHFVVLDNNGINAFAAPGGYVFVTSGLMGRMRSEAELAGVLSHEIAHVVRKHHLKAIQKGAWASLGADLAKSVAVDKGVSSDIANLGTNLVKNLYVNGLSKDEEFEADRLGVVIAARAGYDPYGLPAVLQMMQVFSPTDPAVSLAFATHPPIADRLTMLDKSMSPALDRFEKQPTLAPRYSKAMHIK